MKKKLFYTLVFLSVPLILSAESINKTAAVKNSTNKTVAAENSAKASKAGKGNAVKTANFRPGERNPFLSDEEITKIEQEKEAEKRRLIEEERAKIEAEIEAKKKAAQEEIKRRELLLHPSREIVDKISVDGILGNDAIVNGEVVSVGSKVLGAKVLKVTDNSVWFIYKGEHFQVKLALLENKNKKEQAD